MRFNITPAASRDMASIADDLADRVGLNSSDRFLQGVTAKIAWLTPFSSMGRRRDDLAPGIRSLNYEKYLIFYRARSKEGFKSIPTEFLNTPDLVSSLPYLVKRLDDLEKKVESYSVKQAMFYGVAISLALTVTATLVKPLIESKIPPSGYLPGLSKPN